MITTMVIVLSSADGHADPYYLRFTSPEQSGFILGTSKAAQGLRPDVMHEILKSDLYNYSFDISKSPYGPKYLKSIQRKLSAQTQNGIFILTVDCWSVSTRESLPDDAENFIENNTCVGQMNVVNQNPNFKYLWNHFSGHYYKILAHSSESFLHDDGWLEVSLDMDASSVNRRTKSTLLEYEHYLSKYQFSNLRFQYLVKTIDFLKQYGEVYLVRLPISEKLMKIEQRVMPDFNLKIKSIENKTNGYLDLTHQNIDFAYTDGVHLSKSSSKIVSAQIAHWIKKQQLYKNE
ncbi:MAG: hypothetical protein U0X58_01180 [Flavobacteriaceae bacterium]